MKKLILLLFFLPLYINAQSGFVCNSVLPPNFYTERGYTGKTTAITTSDECYIFNVKCHYVLGTNGENIWGITEEKILRIIAYLNMNFNQHKIFFKYRGTNVLYDSNYTDINTLPLGTVALKNKFIQEGLYEPNMLNFFVVQGANQGDIPHDLYLGASAINNGIEILKTALHEIGHTFNLGHIDPIDSDEFNTNLPDCIQNAADYLRKMYKPIFTSVASENVTRDPLNPLFNALDTGDRLADTDAAFYNFNQNFCKDGSNPDEFKEDPRVVDNSGDSNTSSYYCFSTFTKYSYTIGNNYYTTATNGVNTTSNNLVYTNIPLGNATWQTIITTILSNCTQVGSGETYKNLVEERHNPMLRRALANDGLYYTAGQVNRMREAFNSAAYGVAFHNKLNLLEDGSPNFEVLFEPYSERWYGGAIVSTTAQGNGTALVCRTREVELKYQPGFTYNFLDTYSVTADINNIPVFSNSSLFPLTIAEVGSSTCNPNNTMLSGVACTKGLICTEETFKQGIIISTRDLLNMNVNIEELDAIKVKDPQLYDSLMSEYYYKLIKETESGAKVEQVFYKP